MRTPYVGTTICFEPSLGPVEKHLSGINSKIRDAQATLAQARQDIAEIHTSHAGELARQTAANQAASEQARVRASLEQQVAKLEALEQQRAELNAELVLVMNSDGRVGVIETCGNVDECREQIIDLLEGGREAFDLRSKRYAAR
jgi:hypothetical protein